MEEWQGLRDGVGVGGGGGTKGGGGGRARGKWRVVRYLSNILKQFQANEVNNNKICFHSDGKLGRELVTLRFSISVAIALTSLLSSLFQNEISYTRSPESDRKVCTRLQIGPHTVPREEWIVQPVGSVVWLPQS